MGIADVYPEGRDLIRWAEQKRGGKVSLPFYRGEPCREYEAFLYRFANLLGTPNVLTAGHMYYVSGVGATLTTCGNLPICDYTDNEPGGYDAAMGSINLRVVMCKIYPAEEEH